MLRTTILILALVMSVGCANTHEARRSAAPVSCESCGTPKKPTLMERLGFGRRTGTVGGGSAPMPTEMPLPTGTIGAGEVPEASPILNVEPAGSGRPQARTKEAKEMKSEVGKSGNPKGRMWFA